MSGTAPVPQRDWLLDVLRAASVVVVVLLHWTWMRITYVGHGIELRNSLNGGIMRALTWLLMIMPVFFLAGGYANARIVDRCRARGESFGTYLGGRARRLLAPALPLLVVFTALAFVTPALGAATARTVAHEPANVLWFLPAYLICTALAPLQVWVHDRLGWWVGPTAWLVGAAVIDALHWNGVLDGTCNMLFVWPACHALGVLYARGTLRRTPLWVLVLVATGVGAAIWGTVRLGWFAPQTIGLADSPAQNLMPPTSVLAWLGVIQFCLLVPTARRLAGWAPKPWAQRVILTLNRRLIHVYLWHVPVLAALTGVALLAPHWLLPVDPTLWWATRLLWLPPAVLLLDVVVRLASRWDALMRRYGARNNLAGVLAACLLGVVGLDVLWLRGLTAAPVCLAAVGAVAASVALLTVTPAAGTREDTNATSDAANAASSLGAVRVPALRQSAGPVEAP